MASKQATNSAIGDDEARADGLEFSVNLGLFMMMMLLLLLLFVEMSFE